MNYLAVGNDTDKIVYAVFENTHLATFGIVLHKKSDTINQMQEIYTNIEFLIKENKIDILVVRWFNLFTMKRTPAFNMVAFRTILQLACGNNGVVYLEADSYGWEKYLLKETATIKDKLAVLNRAYGINLYIDEVNAINDGNSMADTIILGEALAHQRLIAKPRQPIQYKWKIGG